MGGPQLLLAPASAIVKISIREPKMKMTIKIAMKISIREPSGHSCLTTTS